jgi:DNA-directed RNA polymerase subunit RPC12/RpoP
MKKYTCHDCGRKLQEDYFSNEQKTGKRRNFRFCLSCEEGIRWLVKDAVKESADR